MSHHPTGHAMRPRRARGFTLVELLIAMTLTLMLVYAIAQFYAFVGETVRDGRAQIEMGGQLRAASQRLQQDFAELTVRVGGRIDYGQSMGCLEIWEGVASDSDANGDQQVNAQGISNDLLDAGGNLLDLNGDGKADSAMFGDCDDILVMTIRSQGEPFVGRWFNPATGTYQIVQSNLAEVIWFTTFKDTDSNSIWDMAREPRFLVRRQLLIRPDLALGLPAGQSNTFYHNDISAHWNTSNSSWVPNSLADLSRRENRCVHQNFSTPAQNGLTAALGYMPNPMQLNVGIPVGQVSNFAIYSLDGIPQFTGEDKILSNVLAFDVRVYDPFAGLWADNLDLNGSTATTNDDAQDPLSPGDPGYAYAITSAISNNANAQPLGNGAYVDLWYNRAFANLPPAMRTTVLQKCNSAYSWTPNRRNYPGGAIWDIWTTAYEKDGLPQVPPGYLARPVPNIDWLVDGLDNTPNINGVDDPSEAETAPPYPAYVGDNGWDDNFDGNADDASETAYSRPLPTTLRGIEVRIRIYEPGTRQTRQATVATDFIPE